VENPAAPTAVNRQAARVPTLVRPAPKVTIQEDPNKNPPKIATRKVTTLVRKQTVTTTETSLLPPEPVVKRNLKRLRPENSKISITESNQLAPPPDSRRQIAKKPTWMEKIKK